MSRIGRSALAAGALILAAGGAEAAQPLKVCLSDLNAPFAQMDKDGKGDGLDRDVAKAIADKLGRPLEEIWFETDHEHGQSFVGDVTAMLSGGFCDLMVGYPLTADAIGDPAAEKHRIPKFGEHRTLAQRPWVDLKTIQGSRPYYTVTYTIVLSPKDKDLPVQGLGDLKGKKVAVELATLAAELTAHYDHDLLEKDMVQVQTQYENVWDKLVSGEADAAMVERHRAETYVAAHPEAGLKLTGFAHKTRFNLGVVSAQGTDMKPVDDALAALDADGTLKRLTEARGLSWVEPREPWIFPPLTPAILLGE
jgi:ABC-type amino acid transport substrate-binding protein